jgi:8-oxo-dGTP pyrophosphatase MutT (NUDIX family)
MTDVRRLEAFAAVRAGVAARAAVPADAREASSAARILAELDRLERPFDRDADPTHLTASAIVVSERGLLLHRHRKLGLWLQPGGHIDLDEAPATAAWREVLEETGLRAAPASPERSIVHVDVHPGPHGHTHLDLRYLFEAPPEEPSPPPGESQDVRWFGWDEAIDMADPGLIGALRLLRPAT